MNPETTKEDVVRKQTKRSNTRQRKAWRTSDVLGLIAVLAVVIGLSGALYGQHLGTVVVVAPSNLPADYQPPTTERYIAERNQLAQRIALEKALGGVELSAAAARDEASPAS